MAERSKALDWNSSNIFTGVPGFESLSLRHNHSLRPPEAVAAYSDPHRMRVRESPAVSLTHLQQIFGASLYAAAQRLVDSGGVSDVRLMQTGNTVAGVASGKHRQHRVFIQYRAGRPGDAPLVEGECNCGERNVCVHVAAVALAAANSTSGRSINPAQARGDSLSQRPVHAAPGQQQQLCYLLIERAAAGPAGVARIELSAWVGQIAAGDQRIQPESVCTFVPRPSAGHGEFPRYVTAADREILHALLARRSDGPWPLDGAAGAHLLWQTIASGRAYWESFQRSALRIGTQRSASCVWETLLNGDQCLRCMSDGQVDIVTSVEPAVYVDAAAGECGPLELPYSSDLLRHYQRESPIAPERIAAANEHISRHAGGHGFPRLRQISIQPQPLLRIQARLVLSAGPQATVHYLYNGLQVDAGSLPASQPTVRAMSGDVLYEIERDADAEQRLRAQFEVALGAPPWNRRSWLAFMANAAPALRTGGWNIVIEEDFPYRIAAAGDWYGNLETGTERTAHPHAPGEWFDLRLGIRVDGRPVNLLPALAAYLQESFGQDDPSYCLVGAALFVKLDDGRYVQVAVERIQRIADTLVELFDRDSLNSRHALSLSRSQTSRLAQLVGESDGPALQSDDPALAALIEGLKQFSAIEPLPAPPGFQAALRPYQQEGLGWLQFLRRYALGGILADDMGLGKTAQALAHLTLEKAQGRLRRPALIVAPVSVIGNWQREIRRFTPGLKLLTLHGPKRSELFADIGRSDIVVTGYPLLQLDSEVLLSYEFGYVILDEAQMIKNPRAKVSQVARALRAEHRLCLTGTPLENHLGELWSLFEFLQPGLLGDEKQFQRRYRTPIEKQGDAQRAAALARRIAPFMLRRTKDAVATELPAKTQIVESIVMEERQRDLYDGIRLSMHGRMREIIQRQGLARSHITVLDALLKLRQACCDPRLIPDAQAQDIPSAKLDWLSTVLPELVAEGRRILLFSQFTSMLALIEAAVAELSIPYCLLTGSTRDRTGQIERFQSGAAPLFLISLKAGGTGLNLTAADTVIHYDPWWNPAVEAQATDRAHRIGQHQPVFVYKLIAANTVEEKIMQLQAGKQALASQLYTDKAASPLRLTADDVEMLFAP